MCSMEDKGREVHSQERNREEEETLVPSLGQDEEKTGTLSTDHSSVCVKQEPSDDIKDYAETTMNELLGWYGYTDKVNQQDTAQLTLTSFQPSSSSSSCSSRIKTTDGIDNGRSGDSTSDEHKEDTECVAKKAINCRSEQCVQDAAKLGDSSSQDKVCTWCQKSGVELFALQTPSGTKGFCSESCFTQCRRANFKKDKVNIRKVCDWCKHVRHTTNFVDLQEGENQLQYCSEKCLNQYKMNIFCTETQEHLKQIQSQLIEERRHAAKSPDGEASASFLSPGTFSDSVSVEKNPEEQILITPELWLAKQTRDKTAKMRTVEKVGREEEEAIEKKSNAGTTEQIERDCQSSSTSSERNESRESSVDKKMSQPSTAPSDFAIAVSHTNSLHLGVPEARRTLGPDVERKRTIREREHLLRLFREDTGSRRLSQTSDSPSSKHSPASQRPVSERSSSPLPQLNGLGSELTGLGMYSPLLCSSLLRPASAEDRGVVQRHQLSHTDHSRRDEGGSRPTTCDKTRIPFSSSSLKTVHNSSSQGNTITSSGPPPPSHQQHLPPPGISLNVPPLNGHAGFPQDLPLPPLMFGLPPFACPPGFFPPDPILAMGGLLGMQDTPPRYLHPPRPSPHPHHQQQDRRQERSGTEGEGPSSSTDGSPSASVPPVTVMMPLPVVLPIPVPIPIPIPVAPERIHNFFGKQEQTTNKQSSPLRPSAADFSSLSLERQNRSHKPQDLELSGTVSHQTNHSPPYDNRFRHPLQHQRHHQPSDSHKDKQSEVVLTDNSPCQSPNLASRHRLPPNCCRGESSSKCLSAIPCHTFPKPHRQSMDLALALRNARQPSDCLRDFTRETTRSISGVDAVSQADLTSKRSLTPVFSTTLNLRKRARLDENRNNEDVAMDLSKDGISPTSCRSPQDFSIKPVPRLPFTNGTVGTCNGTARKEVVHDMTTIDGDPDSSSKVPKIHIIDTYDDPPLAQPLPLPPADHAYSVRRNLILDAPSVPRPARSPPSPEWRYVRTVPREMVEAAKRRCIRARIRSK